MTDPSSLSEARPAAASSRLRQGVAFGAVAALYSGSIAALLTFCDTYAHYGFGVLRYLHPTAVALLPGHPTDDVFVGFLRIGGFCGLTGWALFRRAPPARLGRGLLHTAVFVGAYFASGRFVDHPMSLHVAFLGVWCGQLLTFGPDLGRLVAFSVLLAALGPSFEGYYVEQGFFEYLAPHAYHVPVWLAPLYLNGALAVAGTVGAVEDVRRRWAGDGAGVWRG